MRTLPSPPAYTHGYDAQDMLDADQLDLITRHYKTATTGDAVHGDFDVVMGKKFSAEERNKAAMVYGLMRDHGFYPARLDEYGRVVWAILLKSPAHVGLDKWSAEHEGMEYSRDQVLRRMA